MLRKVYVGSIAVTGLIAVLAGCGSGQQTSLARGQELFKTCIPCHGADGGGNLALRTPDIAGLPDWYLRAELHFGRMEDIFKSGLHEFLVEFIRHNSELGALIERDYMLRGNGATVRDAPQ